MDQASDIAGQVKSTQRRQRAGIARGSEKLRLARERARRAQLALMKPRDRHLNTGRLRAAVLEISKDIASCEKELDAMKRRDEEVRDALSARNDHLLSDCLALSRIVDSKRLFEDADRARSLADPVGGESWQTLLPDWVPGGNRPREE